MPGLFDPIRLRGLELRNRIMVSPMCQYQAGTDARVTDWHLVHYGSLALGGPSLVMTEATAVQARGRISPHDLGIYHDDHLPGLARVVEFAHAQGVRMGVQLAHAGRKAGLEEPIIAPSAVAFSNRYQVPVEMTEADMDQVIDAFSVAAGRAVKAGFDCVEIHAAHGYLLHQFLSPVSNFRTDAQGASLVGRMRFPVRVVEAVRAAVPDSMPVFVRVSASEYDVRGYSEADVHAFCTAFKDAGADVIDVSSGGNLPIAPQVFPGYQVALADKVRTHVQIPVATVGMLDDPRLAEHVIREGRADIVAIGRGFLRDKHWAHSAAGTLGQPVQAPEAYRRAY